MFAAKWTPTARKQYDALRNAARACHEARQASGREKSTKPEGLFKQIRKAIALLQSNPRHPGLRTHEYHSLEHPSDPAGKVFEAYAQNKTPGAYRIFWCYGPGKKEITLIAITPHP